uniref:uncharacterized protein LOC122779572 isoform X1 n=1 Tax=Solea senegalensis TaxID=28829 RepID=UPI001CD82DDA|nr:uncharacterized protein LOC122779572 isoform X1 [Solea senegalensis]
MESPARSRGSAEEEEEEEEQRGSGRRDGEEPGGGVRSELLMYLTCLPERYRSAKFSLAAYLLCWALLRWYQKLRCQSAPAQPQEALEEYSHPSEEGDFAADSLERFDRSLGGGDTSDEYFDSHSWHSDALSDLTPDGEECLVALLELEEAYDGRRATGSSFHSGQSKGRRRESVTAKNSHGNKACLGQTGCSRRKSPENYLDSALSARDLCSSHPHQEEIKGDLQQQPGLQTACTESQLDSYTEPHSSQLLSQHNRIKVNTPPDTQEVKLLAEPEEDNPHRWNECAEAKTHIDATEAQQLELLGCCDVQDVEKHNIKLCDTEKNTGLTRSISDSNDHRQRGSLQQHRIVTDDTGSESVRACRYQTHPKIEIRCKNDSYVTDGHFTGVTNAHKSKCVCTPAHSNDTDRAETWESNNTNSETLRTQTSAAAEESPSRGASESHPQVCYNQVSGVCFQAQQCVCAATVTEGTVKEICSSVTFSQESSAALSLDAGATEQIVSKESTGRDRDNTRPLTLKPRRGLGQTQDRIHNKLDQEAHLDSTEPGPDSSEESLHPHMFSDNQLFLSGNQEAEETSRLLSGKFTGGGGTLGSSCPRLRQTEDACVVFDQKNTVEIVRKVSLPQSGTAGVSELREQRVIPGASVSHPFFLSQQLPNTNPDIRETSTHADAGQSRQVGNGERPSPGPDTISQQTAVSADSRRVQLDLPEPLCSLRTSLLSDSNNNTKASIRRVQRGEGVGCVSAGVQISCKDNGQTKDLTPDHVANVDDPQDNSVASLSSLVHRSRSNEDVKCSQGKDLCNHLYSRHVHTEELEQLTTQERTEDKKLLSTFWLQCANVDEALRPINVDVYSECKEEKQLRDHNVPAATIDSLSESKCSEHPQVYSHPSNSLNLLTVRGLEPIWESEHPVEKKDPQIMRPAEDRGVVSLSGDTSSPAGPRHQAANPAELEADVHTATPVQRSNSEKHCRPMTVAYDAVCYTSVSGSCSEYEDAHFSAADTHADADGTIKRRKTKQSQTGNRGSAFSVFAKMPSFRKAKGAKGCRSEEVPQESLDGGEGPMSEQGPGTDNLDDEVFEKDQTFQQEMSPVGNNIEKEDCGFLHSTPNSDHVPHLDSQSSVHVGNGGTSPDNALSEQVDSPNRQSYKRSKSNDSLNIRMRFAQAHKTLSSLFESRSIDKKNEDSVDTDVDSGKIKQSWRKLKKAKEAELLKKPQTASDGECSSITSGQDCGHFASSPLLDRSSNPGSLSSIRNLRHTDPISKRGFSPGSGNENPLGCKSEGQRRKCSPNASLFDDSPVLQTNHSGPGSPLSPTSSASFAHQHSVACEGVSESPLRPMSPKPNSPRPAAQRKLFRFPHSSRATSVCPTVLAQSVSVEGLTDPPERPKTLKPSTSPLGVSLSLLDAAEHRTESQSHINLFAIGFISDPEGTHSDGRPASHTRTRKHLDVEGEGKSSVVLGGLRTGHWVDVGRRQRNSTDDLWIEEQKKYKRKLARAIRGSVGQLNTLISADMDKTDNGVTSGLIKAFRGMPLKAHCFSHSTPIGLDCLGWRRHVSYTSVVIPDGASEKAALGDELGSEDDLLYEDFRSSGHRFGHPGGGGGEQLAINEVGRMDMLFLPLSEELHHEFGKKHYDCSRQY